jgi:hypothetical protein
MGSTLKERYLYHIFSIILLLVTAENNIQKYKVITVSLVDKETNNHFGHQALQGEVISFNSCSVKPRADMQVPRNECR